MIDWVSATYPQRKEYGKVKIYETSKLLSLSPSGDVRWQRSDAEQVSGSHDSKLYAKSPDQCDLYISGNPVKFFQGHNLFGSSDYVGLWLSAGLAVRQECGLFPSPQTAAATFDQPHFTRLDLTRSYLFPSDAIARSWLREVAAFAHSRHGAPTTQAGTVYWAQGSKRWTMKAYLKSDEIKSRKRSHWISSALAMSSPTGLLALCGSSYNCALSNSIAFCRGAPGRSLRMNCSLSGRRISIALHGIAT